MSGTDRYYLGVLKTDETTARDGSGKYNDFSNGSIVWKWNANAAHFMLADIRDKWRSLSDSDRSYLGYPTQDGVKITNTFPTADAYYSNFEHGIIYQMASAPHVIWGGIYNKWMSMGGTGANVLGTPTSDVLNAQDGVGRYNTFTNGAIFWRPNQNSYEIHGSLYTKYLQMGLEKSVLGYPTTDVGNAKDGGKYIHFEHGSIYYERSKNTTYEIDGPIHDKWAELGWEWSHLGYPTSDVRNIAGGKICDFEGGSISWTPQGGCVVTLKFHLIPQSVDSVDGYIDVFVDSLGANSSSRATSTTVVPGIASTI